MKGLTSIELAILLAIIIVIAVAVGWYMYTTFLASTSSSPKLQIVSAQYSASKSTLTLTVVNPGPVNNVGISAIYLNGVQCGTPSTTTVPISSTPQSINATCSGISAAVGTQLSGQLVTTAGTTFPFTAVVTS
ncbi:MAG: class III signal peptide [Thermoproteus sp.]